MNKTTYFYSKFLEFQILRCGPQIMPSRAAAHGPRVWDPCIKYWCYWWTVLMPLWWLQMI